MELVKRMVHAPMMRQISTRAHLFLQRTGTVSSKSNLDPTTYRPRTVPPSYASSPPDELPSTDSNMSPPSPVLAFGLSSATPLLISSFRSALIPDSNQPSVTTSRPHRLTPSCVQLAKPPVASPAPASTAKRPSASPHLAADGDSLQGTPLQQAFVGAFCAAEAALSLKLAFAATGPVELACDAAAVAAAFLFADLAVGVYHHAVDNYGDENTPVFGFQIAAFQGHHRFPWTITARPVSNNLYRLTLPTLPQVLLLLSFAPAGPLTAFYGTFLAGIVGAQEAHRQAHMTRAAPWVRALQNRGILLPQRMHAAHHRGANEGNYCILSGMWNKQLDRSGFFRRLEAVIYKATDVEPICWGLDPKLKEEAMGLLPILWR